MTDIPAARPRPKIPVWRTAYDGYRLGIGAIFSSGVMFRFFVYGFLSLLIVFGILMYANFRMSALLASTATGANQNLVIGSSFLLGMLVYAAIAAIQTPLGVVVQRYILLGDLPQLSYFGHLNGRNGLRFFRVSIAVYVYFFIGGSAYVPILYLVYHVSPFEPTGMAALLATTPSALAVMMMIFFISYLAASLLAARTTFAFPIAATDRPGPALRQGSAETRGTMWRLFFVFFLTFIPPALVYMVAATVAAISMVGQAPAATSRDLEAWLASLFLSPQFIVAAIVVWIAVMLSFVAMAAAAARAYQIRIERGMSGVAEIFS